MPITAANDSSNSPSPSPQPANPIPSSPGPRANAFTTLYHSALQSTLNAISYESFASCFPLISAQAPQALRAMWQGMRDGLEAFAVSEFELIMQERDVVSRLNALESIIADANRRRDEHLASGETSEKQVPTPPHKLLPEPLVKAHLTPLYLSQQSQLNAKLQTVQSLNAGLMAEIHKQRDEIASLLAQTEMLISDVEGASQVMSNVQKLGNVTRNAETILNQN
ncbi:spindle pole protein Nnf1 [Erysiphe neolycopersici]|uniref:Spindle pole protein Nnf1 n=1 Tax=Erysiphe neolycopersici TaxID=212602 RepID=A0A420I1W2_9PEZI|nr:spindle pole protein Nnf1 [Erysiphe neolycopersici]